MLKNKIAHRCFVVVLVILALVWTVWHYHANRTGATPNGAGGGQWTLKSPILSKYESKNGAEIKEIRLTSAEAYLLQGYIDQCQTTEIKSEEVTPLDSDMLLDVHVESGADFWILADYYFSSKDKVFRIEKAKPFSYDFLMRLLKNRGALPRKKRMIQGTESDRKRWLELEAK
jgi:hypothetical protein